MIRKYMFHKCNIHRIRELIIMRTFQGHNSLIVFLEILYALVLMRRRPSCIKKD